MWHAIDQFVVGDGFDFVCVVFFLLLWKLDVFQLVARKGARDVAGRALRDIQVLRGDVDNFSRLALVALVVLRSTYIRFDHDESADGEELRVGLVA